MRDASPQTLRGLFAPTLTRCFEPLLGPLPDPSNHSLELRGPGRELPVQYVESLPRDHYIPPSLERLAGHPPPPPTPPIPVP
ncbi:hypothetical protein M430DRAFT_47855 [Amorphotheca resinae ATCC 22711]|uniref:Uncharacterized protein n=1 Tax=Amorphotheca resinae ATCC 22711 TaxID=857342 RepID=A0A2T3BAP0_AMORE|nr:hypothetical protein M430DRAFT_47855 [Amorphotheca resinae ATCC 22711]PSS25393.1 hypothetical protein M430DRAFT_47855 [Amorphotheca resinae ATCC 22711]